LDGRRHPGQPSGAHGSLPERPHVRCHFCKKSLSGLRPARQGECFMTGPSEGMLSLVVRHIEGDKQAFISSVRGKIKSCIAAKRTRDCLTITTKSGDHTVIWTMGDGVPYAHRLIAYLRKSKYKEGGREYEVDSILTGEVMDIVVKELS